VCEENGDNDAPVCDWECLPSFGEKTVVVKVQCKEEVEIEKEVPLVAVVDCQSPGIVHEYTCATVPVPECGSSCCQTGNEVTQTWQQGTATVAVTYFNCTQFDECQPEACSGSPCPQGIEEAFSKIVLSKEEFRPLLKDLLLLEKSLDDLKIKNERLSHQFSVWYEIEWPKGADLFDCFEIKALKLETAPVIKCPFGGNNYYICK
jgi:hypothetical protein